MEKFIFAFAVQYRMGNSMADKHNERKQQDDSGAGTRRFRLPQLFDNQKQVDSVEDQQRAQRSLQERANALGVKLPSAASKDVLQSANRFYDVPRATVLPADAEPNPRNVTDISFSEPVSPSYDSSMSGGDAVEIQGESRQTSMSGSPTTGPAPDTEALLAEMEQMREGMEEMYRVMQEIQTRGDAQDKVFNTLHSELQDYKNDFIYEHLKPVVRPLLFLFDHMEQYENELASQVNHSEPTTNERRLLSPDLMRDNISFFRDQLVEALRICEVTPMAKPSGVYDARLHKVIESVPCDAEGHQVIQRVVRSGWYLNGRVFRPAEVVVGRHDK
jgi:molecular chaperone GrpE (heat shock protein)